MQKPTALGVIRRTDRFVTARARLENGRGVVLLTGAPEAPRDFVVQALTDIAQAHDGVNHPQIPKVLHVDLGPTPWLVFDCPAVCDASVYIARLAERTMQIPYGPADAFIVSLRDAMRAMHAKGRFLGRMAPQNVWYSAEGRWWLVGCGRNFPLEVVGAQYDSSVPTFQAPERIGGAPPSAIADFVALIFFMRSVLEYVDLPPRLAKLIRGEFEPADAELGMKLLAFEQAVISALPHERVSIDEAIEYSNAIRAELAVTLDPEAYRVFVETLLAGVGGPPALAMASDGSWVQAADEKVKLGRSQGRLLLSLQRATELGQGLSVDECVAAGWPGESLVFESARNRVYTAIRQLRVAGVPVERFDGGYRLTKVLPLAPPEV